MPEMIFIFLLALLLFGPKKLPQVGRELGKALTEFKRASNDFKNQLETEIEMAEAQDREKTAPPPPQPSLAQADGGVAAPTDPGPPANTLSFAGVEDAAAAAIPETPAPGFDANVVGEPRILPPAEPTVASSFGQSGAPADASSPSAGIQEAAAAPLLPATEHQQLSLLPESPSAGEAPIAAGEHNQPAQAVPQPVAAASASVPHTVEAGALEKAPFRDTNA